jgi:hypothetical protein
MRCFVQSSAGRDPGDVKIPPWQLHDLHRRIVTGMARAGGLRPQTDIDFIEKFTLKWRLPALVVLVISPPGTYLWLVCPS